MADRSSSIDITPDGIGNGDSLALRLAGRIAEAVGNGEPGIDQGPGGFFHRLFHGNGPVIYHGDRRVFFNVVLRKPGFAEYTGVL